MKLTYLELAKKNQVVNASLLPEHNKQSETLEWSMEDKYDGYRSYNIILDLKTKEITIEVYEFIEGEFSEDWIHTETITGQDAVYIALDFNVIQ